MIIETLLTRLTRALAANSAASSYAVAAYRPTITKPVLSTARRVVYDAGPFQAQKSSNTLVVYPFGGNDNNDLIDVKITGWNRVNLLVQNGPELWVSTPICIVQGSLSSALPGIALAPVVAADLMCDTLSLTAGTAVLRQATADVDVASFVCDVTGFELVTLDPITDTGGDGANALFGFL